MGRGRCGAHVRDAAGIPDTRDAGYGGYDGYDGYGGGDCFVILTGDRSKKRLVPRARSYSSGGSSEGKAGGGRAG